MTRSSRILIVGSAVIQLHVIYISIHTGLIRKMQKVTDLEEKENFIRQLSAILRLTKALSICHSAVISRKRFHPDFDELRFEAGIPHPASFDPIVIIHASAPFDHVGGTIYSSTTFEAKARIRSI